MHDRLQSAMPPLRTVAMAVDFFKASHTVDLTTLLSTEQPTKHIPLSPWHQMALQLPMGRNSVIHFQQGGLLQGGPHQGVLQGSIISPLIFNHYVSTYPQTSELFTGFAKISLHALPINLLNGQLEPRQSTRTMSSTGHKTEASLYQPRSLRLEMNPKIVGVTLGPNSSSTNMWENSSLKPSHA